MEVTVAPHPDALGGIVHSRWNAPSPVVTRMTSPSREVTHSRSLAGSSSHGRSAGAVLQLIAGGNARTVPWPAPPNSVVSAWIVSARG